MTFEEFLEKLAETKSVIDWQFGTKIGNSLESIRGYNAHGSCFCPITAVSFLLTGEFSSVGQFDKCGENLGLSQDLITQIVCNADKIQELHTSYRQKLLQAVGLT